MLIKPLECAYFAVGVIRPSCWNLPSAHARHRPVEPSARLRPRNSQAVTTPARVCPILTISHTSYVLSALEPTRFGERLISEEPRFPEEGVHRTGSVATETVLSLGLNLGGCSRTGGRRSAGASSARNRAFTSITHIVDIADSEI
jgi:hypothetical protein